MKFKKGSYFFKAVLAGASAEAIQEAGQWLVLALRQLVSGGSRQKGASGFGRHRDLATRKVKSHSAPGEPPFIQSGDGYKSIGFQRLPNGVRVGVQAMKGGDYGGMPGQNYLMGHDTGEGVRGGHPRPWISHWRRYQDEMARIIIRHMQQSFRK